MKIRYFLILLFFSSAAFAAFAAFDNDKPAGKAKKSSADAAVERDTANYREAMSWFRQGEEMLGTAKENSAEQAALFRKAIAIRPDFLEAHYNLGLIYLNQGKMKEAAAELETVLRLEPQFDAGIYYLLGSAWRESGEFDKALAALEKGVARKPDDINMLKALGYLQFHAHRDEAAQATLEKVVSVAPADAAARLDLALLYQKKDDLAKALASYLEALRLAPDNFAARYNLGLLYMRQRQPEAAAEAFDAARALEPGNLELLERLGDTRTYLKQYILAADAYQAALDHAGDARLLLPKIAFSLASDGNIPGAIAALEKVVALPDNDTGKNADSYFLLGDLYADSGLADKAIAAYQKTLELRPAQKEARLNLGVLYAEKQMYAEAMTELRAAVTLDPNYAPAWGNIALVAENQENDKEAITAYEKLVALGRADARGYFHLGILLAKNNQPDAAYTALAKAVELEPEKYRAILKDELKNVHSVLDSIRFQTRFTNLLAE